MKLFQPDLIHRSVKFLPLVALILTACDPGEPSTGAAQSGASAVGGYATGLSDAEYRSYNADQQYAISNRILTTLYKGVSVADFYDLSEGMQNAQRESEFHTLDQLRRQLQTPLADSERAEYDRMIVGDPDADDDETGTLQRAAFRFDDNRPTQMPLARIVTYPVSRDGFSQWMAWHLANTILFSPAEEIDSADMTDVQNLFRRLDISIMNRRSIREIVATHQRTVENWRRFRSPEDNTREMMEIYLGIFDNDEEVPRASKACQDLYLTDERDGYKLAYTDFPNDEPQLVLGQYVLNCGEFYDVVAGHPLLIPRITSVLVDYFFANKSTEERLTLTQAIVASNPQVFDDIFLAILFSRLNLLDNERPQSFEETYLSMSARLNWNHHQDVFRGMTGGRGSISRTDMGEMGWPAMSLKLGRVTAVPLDSLSFANYHKALRESLMLDRNRWSEELGLEEPDSPTPAPPEAPADDASDREQAAYTAARREYNQALNQLTEAEREQHTQDLREYNVAMARFERVNAFSLPELFDYLFLSAAQRRSTQVERKDLASILNSLGYLEIEFGLSFVKNGYAKHVAVVVFDYLSRLPETYYQRKLQ